MGALKTIGVKQDGSEAIAAGFGVGNGPAGFLWRLLVADRLKSM